MSSPARSYLIVAFSVLCAGFSLCLHAQTDVAGQLRSQLKGKMVMLKSPAATSFLRFHADGSAINQQQTGAWTLYSAVEITDVELRDSGRQLVLTGHRIVIRFDKKEGQQELRTEDQVLFQIEFDSPADPAQAGEALRHIFLAAGEKMSDFAPAYWKPALEELERNGKGAFSDTQLLFRDANVARVGGEIKPPRAIHTPDPRYNEFARKYKLQGQTVLWCIVDEQGHPKNIKVVRPIGLGFDDDAVAAVSGWTFKPATRNGEPVAVQINVEMNFRLQ